MLAYVAEIRWEERWREDKFRIRGGNKRQIRGARQTASPFEASQQRQFKLLLVCVKGNPDCTFRRFYSGKLEEIHSYTEKGWYITRKHSKILMNSLFWDNELSNVTIKIVLRVRVNISFIQKSEMRNKNK